MHQTSVGGNVISTHCDNAGTSTVCVESEGIYDDDPLNPDDYNGGVPVVGGGGPTGGGTTGGNGGNGNNGGSTGGSSGDETEYCEHPFVPELMVDCETNLCGEGECSSMMNIFNDVENPCIYSLVDAFLNNQLDIELTTTIQTIFADNNFQANIVFSDKRALDAPSSHLVTQFNPFGSTIYIDRDRVENSSKEYITSLIIHEVMHSYISYNDISRNQLFQHFDMASQYLEWIASAIKSLHPSLSNQQANALSLRGFNDLFENE
ncbi:MAG: hypothetical protein AAFN93_21330, partial [Bacteroidota bacterium]